MSKILTAYFSTRGITADAAKKIAAAAGGTLCEIKPEVEYSDADLDWRDKSSRSSVEMQNKEIRPAILPTDVNIAEYDVILLGFPIWWYTAPTIVNTFLESCNFDGKRIILFATSGSSGFGSALADLKKSVGSTAKIEEGTVVHGTQSAEEWEKWVKTLSI